ncbi:hypothetical protein HDU92_008039, partial [Lobulomyces angularis]
KKKNSSDDENSSEDSDNNNSREDNPPQEEEEESEYHWLSRVPSKTSVQRTELKEEERFRREQKDEKGRIVKGRGNMGSRYGGMRAW